MGRTRPISVGWDNPAHYQMGWLLCLSTVTSPPSAAERELLHVLHANEGGWRANGGDRAARDYLRLSRGGAAGGVGTVAMVAEARWPAVFLLSLSFVFFVFFSTFSPLFSRSSPSSPSLFPSVLFPLSWSSFFFSVPFPCFYRQKQGGTSWWGGHCWPPLSING